MYLLILEVRTVPIKINYLSFGSIKTFHFFKYLVTLFFIRNNFRLQGFIEYENKHLIRYTNIYLNAYSSIRNDFVSTERSLLLYCIYVYITDT